MDYTLEYSDICILGIESIMLFEREMLEVYQVHVIYQVVALRTRRF